MSRFWTRLTQERPSHERALEGLRFGIQNLSLRPTIVFVAVLVMIGTFVFRNHFESARMEGELARLAPEEIEVVDNMELAKHYDVIDNIELLEDLEVVENLDALQSS